MIRMLRVDALQHETAMEAIDRALDRLEQAVAGDGGTGAPPADDDPLPAEEPRPDVV